MKVLTLRNFFARNKVNAADAVATCLAFIAAVIKYPGAHGEAIKQIVRKFLTEELGS